MADDTLTVEQARQAVIERLCDCDPTTRFNHDTAQCMAEGVRRLDALIAAVRAETFAAGFADGVASIDKYGEQHYTADDAYTDYLKPR